MSCTATKISWRLSYSAAAAESKARVILAHKERKSPISSASSKRNPFRSMAFRIYINLYYLDTSSSCSWLPRMDMSWVAAKTPCPDLKVLSQMDDLHPLRAATTCNSNQETVEWIMTQSTGKTNKSFWLWKTWYPYKNRRNCTLPKQSNMKNVSYQKLKVIHPISPLLQHSPEITHIADLHQ